MLLDFKLLEWLIRNVADCRVMEWLMVNFAGFQGIAVANVKYCPIIMIMVKPIHHFAIQNACDDVYCDETNFYNFLSA